MRNSIIKIILNCLVLVVASSGCSLAQPEKPMSKDTSAQTVPLLDYLHKLGDTYDCFFTLEESWLQGEPMNSLASYAVPDDSSKGKLPQELERLSALVPHLVFRSDPDNPRIIHAVDARLDDLHSYSLVQVIPSIDYTGKGNDVVGELAKRGIRVAPQTGFAIGDPLAMRIDATTTFHMKGERMTVRSALSNCVPLSAYSRVMWIATTERRAGSITQVNLRGPRSYKNEK
jgi:hypothetical protein